MTEPSVGPDGGDEPAVGRTPDAEVAPEWDRVRAMIEEYYWVIPYPEDIPARQADAAQVWADALATICPPAGPVSCASETFAPVLREDGVLMILDTDLEVVTEDTALLRSVLATVAERFMLIDTDGREWTWPALEEALMSGQEVFTSPYVSDLKETDGAVGFWFDVEGNPYPDMARAQIVVLLEELDRAGITEARIRPLTESPAG